MGQLFAQDIDHDDNLGAILYNRHPKQKLNKQETRHKKRAIQKGEGSNKVHCGNPGFSQPESQITKYNFSPVHFETNTDNAGSQQER